MSETDTFIDEVAEEVRRDRLFALMKRYGWIAILAVLAIVGGAAWNEWQKARAQAASEAFGDALLAAVASPEAKDRAQALAQVDTGGAVGHAAVAAMLTAADAEAAGDVDAALAALHRIADDPAQGDLYRQLALLKIITLSGDRMDAQERATALAGMAAPGAPFRALAMEQQALDLLDAGKTDEAAALMEQLAQDADATPALQGRIGQILTAIGKAPAAGE